MNERDKKGRHAGGRITCIHSIHTARIRTHITRALFFRLFLFYVTMIPLIMLLPTTTRSPTTTPILHNTNTKHTYNTHITNSTTINSNNDDTDDKYLLSLENTIF